jgi:hypothetical protein
MWPGMGGASFTGLIPPNAKGEGSDHVYFDHILKCGAELDSDTSFGTAQEEYECVTVSEEVNAYAAARSRHVGGVNVVFAGNNTQFIAESIDLAVWRALCTRAGPNFWNKTVTPPTAIWVEKDPQPGNL